MRRDTSILRLNKNTPRGAYFLGLDFVELFDANFSEIDMESGVNHCVDQDGDCHGEIDTFWAIQDEVAGCTSEDEAGKDGDG